MRRTSDDFGRLIRSKRGSQMVEAAISLPIVILTVMLLVRMFTFYLEILDTGICEHMKALEYIRSYRGAVGKTYTNSREILLLRGGILKKTVSKRIDVRAYMFNEDLMVRASEVFGG